MFDMVDPGDEPPATQEDQASESEESLDEDHAPIEAIWSLGSHVHSDYQLYLSGNLNCTSCTIILSNMYYWMRAIFQ